MCSYIYIYICSRLSNTFLCIISLWFFHMAAQGCQENPLQRKNSEGIERECFQILNQNPLSFDFSCAFLIKKHICYCLKLWLPLAYLWVLNKYSLWRLGHCFFPPQMRSKNLLVTRGIILVTFFLSGSVPVSSWAQTKWTINYNYFKFLSSMVIREKTLSCEKKWYRISDRLGLGESLGVQQCKTLVLINSESHTGRSRV